MIDDKRLETHLNTVTKALQDVEAKQIATSLFLFSLVQSLISSESIKRSELDTAFDLTTEACSGIKVPHAVHGKLKQLRQDFDRLFPQ